MKLYFNEVGQIFYKETKKRNGRKIVSLIGLVDSGDVKDKLKDTGGDIVITAGGIKPCYIYEIKADQIVNVLKRNELPEAVKNFYGDKVKLENKKLMIFVQTVKNARDYMDFDNAEIEEKFIEVV